MSGADTLSVGFGFFFFNSKCPSLTSATEYIDLIVFAILKPKSGLHK